MPTNYVYIPICHDCGDFVLTFFEVCYTTFDGTIDLLLELVFSSEKTTRFQLSLPSIMYALIFVHKTKVFFVRALEGNIS